MNYKLLFLTFVIFLNGCVTQIEKIDSITQTSKISFSTKGFALIFDDQLYSDNLVNRKIENRSLIIFQKNLKKNTMVKVTNLINSKYIIAKVGKKTDYPVFFNSVLSKRIANELEINKLEPYIEIKEILQNSSFVAKKAKTFDEEKKVATKVPVDDIKIKDLNVKVKKKEKINKSKFNYIVKIADFYFIDSANRMKSRILEETSIKNVKISKLSATQFRVFIGPYSNLNSLKKSFNAINTLQFDNIEIIKK